MEVRALEGVDLGAACCSR